MNRESEAKAPRPDPEFHKMVDAYVRGRLEADQCEAFEIALIADPVLQEKTRQAFVLRQLVREFPEQFANPSRWGSAPLLQYALAASLGAALVAAPAWWVQERLRAEQGNLSTELAQAKADLRGLLQPQVGLAVLHLGTTRSQVADRPVLRKSADVRWAQLWLPELSPARQGWPSAAEVLLLSPAADQRWRYRLDQLRAQGDLMLLLPLSSMAPGEYSVVVEDQGSALAQYSFDIVDEASLP